jgi:mRNA interferase RelE/StbE
MYQLIFEKRVKKDFKNINRSDILFIKDTLNEFVINFNETFEQNFMQKGKIKKLKGTTYELYRLKLRNYRVIYKKEKDKLIILVLNITSRKNSYKKL